MSAGIQSSIKIQLSSAKDFATRTTFSLRFSIKYHQSSEIK